VIAAAPAIVNALARIVSPTSVGGADGLFSLPLHPENVLRAWQTRPEAGIKSAASGT
jgi:hypothetical protein